MLSEGRLRGRVVILAAVIVALMATGTWFALSHAQAKQAGLTAATSGQGHHTSKDPASSGPLRVLSLTPAGHARNVNGALPVQVRFSAALAAGSPLPTISPAIRGSWQRSGDVVEFVPKTAFAPLTRVTVRVPAGRSGVTSAGGGMLASRVVERFRVGSWSTVRLDQLLAQLGYLPLTWTPASGAVNPAPAGTSAQLAAAFSPPAGTFSWQHGYPRELRTFWQPGKSGLVLQGAVMAFESDHLMTMDGVAGPAVWHALLRAVAAGQDNSHGYTYARASENSPETLTIWHDGHVVLRTPANTGIPAAPTTVGTAAVYLRYRFQIMRGTNPDGSKYADPVSFVSYFRAGEAVHYFPRGSYGFPQSLGCVELPYGAAEQAWPYLTYGSLVTVAPPS